MKDSLTITQPDDWHLHVRDGDVLEAVIGHTAARFGRAVIMPNLVPPITTVAMALDYRQRILSALAKTSENLANTFNPLMTLYLTPATSPEVVKEAAKNKHIIGIKWYPAGATTHSDEGIEDISTSMATLEAMAEHQLPLLVHGEVTNPEVDVFDREARFIETILDPVLQKLPQLKVVLEHITTEDGIAFVKSQGDNVGGTLTPQHLLLNRTDLFKGGIRPHLYCLPILKRERHRIALLSAATSGNRSFFLGTDSAPHTQDKKESACGCAGIYSAHAGIELYAEVFDQANALDKLDAFASKNGPAFYGLAPNAGTITLQRSSWQAPEWIELQQNRLIPFRAGEAIEWTLKQ